MPRNPKMRTRAEVESPSRRIVLSLTRPQAQCLRLLAWDRVDSVEDNPAFRALCERIVRLLDAELRDGQRLLGIETPKGDPDAA
jgi:hypothetical protein